jgi:hypothetical protein
MATAAGRTAAPRTRGRNTGPVKLRLALKARNTLVPLALFALAFIGSLLAMKRATPVAPVSAIAIEISVTSPPRIAGAPASSHRTEMAPAISAPSGVAVTPTISAPAGLAPATGGRPATSVALATSVAWPVAPAPMVDRMPLPARETLLPGIKESFSMLSFGTTEERIRAIQAIAEAARSGSEVAGVRRALRLTAADPDPEVAARAQEEYEQLSERDDR